MQNQSFIAIGDFNIQVNVQSSDEASLRFAIKDYIRFYSEERPQDRYHCKTPLEVRTEALSSESPMEYPIPENKRIVKYKEKWCA